MIDSGKIIIDYEDGISPREALAAVSAVVAEGKISEAGGVPHYCWHTVMTNCLEVSVRRKKRGQESDSFVVRRSFDRETVRR